MSRNISDLLVRLNRNTTLNAHDLNENKNNLSKMFSIRRIFSRFFKCFVLRKGYKSGEVGLLISILSAIYPFISAMKVKSDLG